MGIQTSWIDQFVLINTFSSFFLFVLIHITVFRFVSQKSILKWLERLFWIIGGVNIAVNVSFIFIPEIHLKMGYSTSGLLLSLICSFFIFVILTFVYAGATYGMYESSLRIRLLREIAAGDDQGISLNELLERYNAQILLQTRLARLMSSGELVRNGDAYHLGRSFGLFILYARVVAALRRIFGEPEVCDYSYRKKICDFKKLQD